MSKSTITRERDAEARKERLVHAAMQIFARDGFQKASLRQICTKARANLAAVKYYFGSKEGLYRESLFESHRQALSQESPVVMTKGENAEVT